MRSTGKSMGSTGKGRRSTGKSTQRTGVILVLMSAACLFAAAQTSDIRGAYETVIEGVHLRVNVVEEASDASESTYSFELYSKYEDDVVFESPLSQDRFYVKETDRGVLKFRFDDEGCTVTDRYGSYYLFKRNGSRGDIAGGYSAAVEGEGYLALQVEPSQGGCGFRLESWEGGVIRAGESKNEEGYSFENELGETFELRFMAESCILRIDDSPFIWLEKTAAGDLSAFIPTESTWWKTLPDFSVGGDAAEAFEAVYHAEPPPSAKARAERLTVAKQAELEFEGNLVHSLSPDGGRIAFADNFFFYMREPDLHLIDLDKRILAKLTEDGSKNIMKADPETGRSALIDISPIWLADSRRILFQRLDAGTGRQSRLYIFSIDTGAAAPATEILATGPNITTLHLDYRSGTVYYTYSGWDREDENGGIWRMERGQRRPIQILSAKGKGWEYAILKEVAFSGDSALIYHPAGGSQDPYEAYRFSLLDLESLETTEIGAAALESEDHEPAVQYLNAAFSPDGSKVLYSYMDYKEGRGYVAVRDTAGGPENILLSTDDPHPGFYLKNSMMGILGLDWAVNDTVLVLQSMGRSALILELKVR